MDLGGDDETDLQSYEDEQLAVRMTQIAAAERHEQVQMMLSKQLDKGGSLEEQLEQRKSFTKGSAVKSISDHTRGQLSLRDFVFIQEENQTVDDLRDRGLTDQEIAFKLQQERGKTPTILQAAKRSHLAVDPSIQSKRLKAVNKIIREPHQEDQPGSSNQDGNPSPQPRKGIFSQLSLSKKFTHPDDPINSLQVIEADLLKKLSSSTDKDSPGVYQGCEPRPEGYKGQYERTSSDDVTCESRIPGRTYGDDDANVSTDNNKSSQPSQLSPYGEWIEVKPSKTHVSECRDKSHLAENKPKSERRQLQGQVSAVSVEDIKSHRLTVDEICQLDRFKNYSAGTPSKVLYLKNLSKQVSEADLLSLFIRFQTSDKDKLVFKLLSGRMRGQAFITFPDIETATSALNLINGYELKGKPIIIQYGKQQDR